MQKYLLAEAFNSDERARFVTDARGKLAGNEVQATRQAKAETKRIMLVEDDPAIAELLEQLIVQETPYQVVVLSDSLEALARALECPPRLLILDYGLPGLNGIELYDRLHEHQALQAVPSILISANIPLREVRRREMFYLRKPFEMSSLLEMIHNLLG
jgi:DNA-binding response OmpR family regulator